MKVSPPSTTGAILSLAALVSAGTARKCADVTIEVPLVARNAVFNRKAPENNIEITNFILDLTRQGHNLTNEVLAGVSIPSSLSTPPPRVHAGIAWSEP